MEKENKIRDKENLEIAGKQFDPSDHNGNTQVEKGLATTHEQAEDDYMEGTIDQLLK
ncbi:YozQ family protein [Bacillus sp. AK128]